IPKENITEDVDGSLKEMGNAIANKVETLMDDLNISQALEEIWKLIRRTNKYVDETMPWILAKEQKKDRLDTVLLNLAESLRIISILIKPFMERTSSAIRSQLGMDKEATWDGAKSWKAEDIAGNQVIKGEIIFPRLEIDKELVKLNNANEALIKIRAKEKEMKEENKKPEITIDEFDKMDLRVGKILNCEDHPNADKLLVFDVQIGEETRTI